MQLDIELLRKLDRVHPYPAKFPIDLAIQYIPQYTDIGDTVFDPFVGSGTTLLASSVLNRIGYGTDINYIAILISSFKLLSLQDRDIEDLQIFISRFKNQAQEQIEHTDKFSYPSIEHWFCENSILVLSTIKKEISALANKSQKLFCNLVFSSIINTVSNQESDTRYAAIDKANMTIPHIIDIFTKKFEYILSLFSSCRSMFRTNEACKAFLHDAKYCDQVIPPDSVDFILTSPPYPNTYDYYLYHKHRMNWLEYDVKFSMNAEIGSRREYSSLKKPQEKFDEDLFQILYTCNKLLKSYKHAVIVMGDGKIQGNVYDAKTNIEKICRQINWRLIDYSYTDLDKTSRSFRQSYRTKGKKEHVMTFVKEG